MVVYLDSSALVKRVLSELESDALEASLDQYAAADAVLVSSSLAWVEVGRALRSRMLHGAVAASEVSGAVDDAMAGVAERLITADVIGVARRIGSATLRSLDAIHLATAILLDVDLVIAYDQRLLEACRHNALMTTAPGRKD